MDRIFIYSQNIAITDGSAMAKWNGLLWLYHSFVIKHWEVENGHAERT
jgi:hypothetical protein